MLKTEEVIEQTTQFITIIKGFEPSRFESFYYFTFYGILRAHYIELAVKIGEKSQMDITFKTPEGVFNYRVCAIIISNERLLVMKDERSPYYYLPGGRVTLHETAEKAVLREIKEELEINAKIVRPLWLNQSFFTEDVNHEKYHELCLYFLIDVSATDLLSRGNNFVLTENGRHHHIFSWMPFCELNKNYFYPGFIKKRIFNLPVNLEINTEFE